MKEITKKKIIIVDDDKDFLAEFADALTSFGYEVFPFSDSSLVFSAAEMIKPDLMLLDLCMRKENGFRLARKLKNSDHAGEIPLICMTGYLAEQGNEDFMDICGFKTYLIKPFKIVQAVIKIEAACNNDPEQRPPVVW